MVRGDGVYGAVGKPCLHGRDVGGASERRVHLGVGVVAAHSLVGQREVVRSGLTGHLHAASLGIADDARRADGGDVGDVHRRTGEFGQVHLAGYGDVLGRPGNPFKPQFGRDEPFVHGPLAHQRQVFGVGDDGDAYALGVFQRAAHQLRVAYGLAVVRYRYAPGLFKFTHLGQALALAPLGDAADREDVDHRLVLGLVDHVGGNRLAVDDRGGVGHAGHGGEAPCRRRTAAGRDVFLILQARIAQVHMHVDETRGDNQSRRVDARGPVRRRQPFAKLEDHAVGDQYVGDSVNPLGGIDQAPAFYQKIHLYNLQENPFKVQRSKFNVTGSAVLEP